jgi:hypothetical protein
MTTNAVQKILDEVHRWPLAQQIELAQAMHELTWRERWRSVSSAVHQRVENEPIADEDIDSLVDEVRREIPLSQRS